MMGLLQGRGLGRGLFRQKSLETLKDSFEMVSSPIDDTQYVVFDTELTGLNPKKDSIVSIGAIKMLGGRIHLGEQFYRVVAPRTELTGQSVVIHGITPTEAALCPDIDALLPEFLEFCRDSVLVGHFVAMDLGFLNKDVRRIYGAELPNPAVDTQRLYSWMVRQREQYCSYHDGITRNLDLASLAKKYRIPVSRAHNALDDAFVTAQLFQRLLSELSEFDIASVADLIHISGAE